MVLSPLHHPWHQSFCQPSAMLLVHRLACGTSNSFEELKFKTLLMPLVVSPYIYCVLKQCPASEMIAQRVLWRTESAIRKSHQRSEWTKNKLRFFLANGTSHVGLKLAGDASKLDGELVCFVRWDRASGKQEASCPDSEFP